ncbi:hypothetical protein DFH09DRAFT_1290006 [Mycena vulgaris]|nr:hypothetical protein DFH09DRAFT_1290006 [Mycena vulgaris]
MQRQTATSSSSATLIPTPAPSIPNWIPILVLVLFVLPEHAALQKTKCGKSGKSFKAALLRPAPVHTAAPPSEAVEFKTTWRPRYTKDSPRASGANGTTTSPILLVELTDKTHSLLVSAHSRSRQPKLRGMITPRSSSRTRFQLEFFSGGREIRARSGKLAVRWYQARKL